MMRYIFSFFMIAISTPAFSAGNFKYKCLSVDNNEPYSLEAVELSVKSANEVTVKLNVMKLVTEKYEWDSTFASQSESMKNYYKFDVVSPHFDAYGEGPVTPFYIETELLSGGYPLRKGGTGGFIKTTGHGYSWAKYICILINN